MSDARSVSILLVEDDPGHARLIQKNLKRAGLTNPIIHAADGQAALDILFGEGEFQHQEPLDTLLVLLDLNMPVLDGYQVLKAMKSDARTRNIPVIILTTTDDTREVERCYELGCSVYITKPVDYDQFSNAIRQLGLFISIVTVPQRGR
ncbi:MAG: response regulator [Chloroflexi bacterium]|nr:MAG: response regulator [Chloroflexota bacterium]